MARRPRKIAALTREQQELAGSYLPLAIKLSRRFAGAYGLDREEMRSVAYEALVLGATSFDATQSPAATYFQAKIVQSFLDWFRHCNRKKRTGRVISFSAFDDPDRALCLSDRGRQIEAIDLRDCAETLLSRAQCRERDILRACYMEGRTQVQIAEELDVAKSRVSAIKRDGLSRLRRHLEKSPD